MHYVVTGAASGIGAAIARTTGSMLVVSGGAHLGPAL
jgi:NAD(P)-dependent dehydrogenase (short-subunit alcohol dehydrogenase family)